MIRIDRISEDVLAPGRTLGLHRHANAYAALILSGGYEEVGPDGRHLCQAGHMVIHPSFHAHRDAVGERGALIVNIPLDDQAVDLIGYGVLDIGDVSGFRKFAESFEGRLPDGVLGDFDAVDALNPPGWLTAFLHDILSGMPAGQAARRQGRSPEHAGRVCRTWFGLTPVQLRQEYRLRKAIRSLRHGARPADVAAECGFADQPHLTRALKRMTGLTPRRFAS